MTNYQKAYASQAAFLARKGKARVADAVAYYREAARLAVLDERTTPEERARVADFVQICMGHRDAAIDRFTALAARDAAKANRV